MVVHVVLRMLVEVVPIGADRHFLERQPAVQRLRLVAGLTQEELAQLVGASRETVNKALADFASRGWLRLEGKSVVILDPERLARRSR